MKRDVWTIFYMSWTNAFIITWVVTDSYFALSVGCGFSIFNIVNTLLYDKNGKLKGEK